MSGVRMAWLPWQSVQTEAAEIIRPFGLRSSSHFFRKSLYVRPFLWSLWHLLKGPIPDRPPIGFCGQLSSFSAVSSEAVSSEASCS